MTVSGAYPNAGVGMDYAGPSYGNSPAHAGYAPYAAPAVPSVEVDMPKPVVYPPAAQTIRDGDFCLAESGIATSRTVNGTPAVLCSSDGARRPLVKLIGTAVSNYR